jgi:tetratricopeptide (TPR) repeat protein
MEVHQRTKIVRLEADFTPEEMFSVGMSLWQIGSKDKAVEAFKVLVDADPANIGAMANLGALLADSRRFHEAVEVLNKATVVAPQIPQLWSSYAKMLMENNHFFLAEMFAKRATDMMPSYAEFWCTLGHTMNLQMRWKDSWECYNRAVELDPSNWWAKQSRGLTRMQTEGLSDWVGLKDFEARTAPYGWPFDIKKIPLWEHPAPGRILACSEQGNGDILQALRYVPEILKKGPDFDIAVYCTPTLRPLVDRIEGLGDIYSAEELKDERFDYQIGTSSLMRFSPTIPPPVRFRTDDIEIPTREQPTIGICWRGNPIHPYNRLRSMPLKHMLLAVKDLNAKIVSLQYDSTEEEKALVEQSCMGDWTDTIRAYKGCDLIVTVDTFASHLGGSLGVPTKVLVFSAADWRWIGTGRKSVWYPSVELYRQEKPLEWGEVLYELREDLVQQFGTR